MPRMIKVDQSYKLNKQKLLRDIRILKKFYNGKIPAETTNDAEQLKITLSKCKKNIGTGSRRSSSLWDSRLRTI